MIKTNIGYFKVDDVYFGLFSDNGDEFFVKKDKLMNASHWFRAQLMNPIYGSNEEISAKMDFPSYVVKAFSEYINSGIVPHDIVDDEGFMNLCDFLTVKNYENDITYSKYIKPKEDKIINMSRSKDYPFYPLYLENDPKEYDIARKILQVIENCPHRYHPQSENEFKIYGEILDQEYDILIHDK